MRDNSIMDNWIEPLVRGKIFVLCVNRKYVSPVFHGPLSRSALCTLPVRGFFFKPASRYGKGVPAVRWRISAQSALPRSVVNTFSFTGSRSPSVSIRVFVFWSVSSPLFHLKIIPLFVNSSLDFNQNFSFSLKRYFLLFNYNSS